MARTLDFYEQDSTTVPIWIGKPFPRTNDRELPLETGIYRFVSHHADDRQTLFIDDTSSLMYGSTFRSCYCSHQSGCGDSNNELADLYSIEGIIFEYCNCDKEEAKRQRHLIVTQFKPHYNSVQLVISNTPSNNPFDIN